MIIASPTNGGDVVTIAFWQNAEFARVRADLEREFDAVLQLAPDLYERVRRGERSDRFRGTVRLPNFFREASGPGWALVGDAGHHKDPILALGISDALRDAELLAGAAGDGLAGRVPLGSALAGYGRRRDELAAAGYASTLQFARLQPPGPEMQGLFAALLRDQERTDRFFGTIAGTVDPADFFAAAA
jgi:2-polyprenyl-6-methoxyphenol hydroxylase-like FAD-dependent oxidoreductase